MDLLYVHKFILSIRSRTDNGWHQSRFQNLQVWNFFFSSFRSLPFSLSLLLPLSPPSPSLPFSLSPLLPLSPPSPSLLLSPFLARRFSSSLLNSEMAEV